MHPPHPLRRSVASACLATLVLAALDRGRPAPGAADHHTWEAVWRNVRAGTMPPADEPEPSAEERRAIVRFVQHDVFGLDPARPDPGHVVLRRLNREEYARTVRDLAGVSFNVADAFPADDTGYGFDTIGAVLTVSPLLMEKYLEAGRDIAAQAVAPARAAKRDKEGRPAYPRETKAVFFEGPPPADPAAHTAALRRLLERLASRAFRRPVDDATLDTLVRLASTAAGMPASAGPATADTSPPTGPDESRPEDTAAAEADARRRFENAVEIGITALLGAPRFVYRFEAADPAARHVPAGGGEPIDEFSLASRLSYFLWGTMPDEPLLELAATGRLRAELDATIDRMIDDPRCDTFVSSFTGQWLQIRDIESIAFDARRILGLEDSAEAAKVFSGEVRRAMRRETEMLFAHVLREGLPATDLLVAPYTFMNRPLARFYGLESLVEKEGDSKAMRRVDLPADSHRGGLLTHGSVLAVTSNPTRTSPVKRGLFVLENLLGTPGMSGMARPAADPAAVSRRRFLGGTALRGLGLAVALPALESSPPARAAGAAARIAPTRMAFLYVPNGVILDRWKSTGSGRDFRLGETLEPLAPFQGDLQIITRLGHRNGTAGGDGPGDHARASATILTGARPFKTAGSDIRAGVSVDQVAAQRIGEATRFSSLELSCDGVRESGACDSGYSCTYQFNIAWHSPTQPATPESNPRLVFERLFGKGSREERAASLAARIELDRSILDFVADDARRLAGRLGGADRRKLDEYLHGVREIEQRLVRLERLGLPDVPDRELPEPRPMSDLFVTMLDIMGAPVERFGDSTGRLDVVCT